jgi:hypothetical protein
MKLIIQVHVLKLYHLQPFKQQLYFYVTVQHVWQTAYDHIFFVQQVIVCICFTYNKIHTGGSCSMRSFIICTHSQIL